METRKIALIAGVSYLIIFFSAIYANFFVLDSLLQDPLGTVGDNSHHIRFGVIAFLIAAVFDVFVAWALYQLYKGHILSSVSTYFRVMHATIMGVAVFTLLPILQMTSAEEILFQVETFNNIWLIGLFFFGVHLLLLWRIVRNIPIIPIFLALAGFMYIVDTGAHFVLPNYDMYAGLFLAAVAIPSVLGEMALSLWLLFKGGKNS